VKEWQRLTARVGEAPAASDLAAMKRCLRSGVIHEGSGSDSKIRLSCWVSAPSSGGPDESNVASGACMTDDHDLAVKNGNINVITYFGHGAAPIRL